MNKPMHGMTMRLPVLLIFLSGSMLPLIACRSTTPDSPSRSPEAVYAFAEHLEETGDYYRAVTEYKRFIFYWPDHSLAGVCRYRIGRSYLLGEDYVQAMQVFRAMYYDPPVSLKREIIACDYARALYEMQDYTQAAALLETAEELESRTRFQHRIRYARTWCALRRRNPEIAQSLWVDVTSPEYDVSSLRHALDQLDTIDYRNPRIAGFLSALFPGAGQVYAGRWRDGVVSFLVNGLFIGAMVTAVDRGHDETAVVLGFFELGFYTANIYNAVNDTHKENRYRWDRSLARIRSEFGAPFRIGYRF